jgi:hypothetical protein
MFIINMRCVSPPPFQEELKREESPYACIQSYNLVYVQKPKRLQRFKNSLFSRVWLLIFLNYIKFSQIKIQINMMISSYLN